MSTPKTSAPRRATWFITRETAFSLPGMTRAESATVSPSAILTWRWSSIAIRDSAAMGSPWDPVHTHSTSWAGKSRTSLSRICRPPGTFSKPHFHPETRYIQVIKGTWWVGSGPVQDLAGRRFGLPVRPNILIDFMKVNAHKGFYSTLLANGMQESDAKFVEMTITDDMHSTINADLKQGDRPSLYDADVDYLLRGEVDAIFCKNAGSGRQRLKTTVNSSTASIDLTRPP